jgi:hypothetical protein
VAFRFLENLCTAGLPDDCIKHIFFDMMSVVIDHSITDVFHTIHLLLTFIVYTLFLYKFTLQHTMTAQKGSTGTLVLFL